MPLRKEPARGGTLRLIDVEGFDLSACGGTHVARTGGIGVIAVASWERFKGGQRLSFLCGGRALGGYRALRDAVAGAVRLLSVLPEELPQTDRAAAGRGEGAEADARRRCRPSWRATGPRSWQRSAEEVTVASEASAAGRRTARLVARAVDADAPGLKALATRHRRQARATSSCWCRRPDRRFVAASHGRQT